MDLPKTISALMERRNLLDEAIATLEKLSGEPTAVVSRTRAKRQLSPEARERMAAAQRKRRAREKRVKPAAKTPASE